MISSKSNFDNKPSMIFTDLPSSIVAKIFLYTINTTRDFARLRLISKHFTNDVLPLVFTSAGNSVKGSFVKCCYGNVDFLSEITQIESDSFMSGYKWNFPPDNRVLSLFEGSRMQSIFIIDQFHDTHDYLNTTSDNQHAELCFEIYNATNIDELQSLNRVAHDMGVFLPSSAPPTKTASIGVQIRPDLTCVDDTMYEDLFLNAIITLKVPHNAPCITRTDGKYIHLKSIIPDENISNWTNRTSDDNKDIFFLPHQKDEGGVYVGHIIQSGINENTVIIAMRVRSLDEVAWDLETSFSCELLSLSHIWNTYQERMSVSEGVAIADGILHSLFKRELMTIIDKFAASQEVDYHPHSNNVVRDIVHPALYSFVKGVSHVLPLEEVPPCDFTYDTIGNKTKQEMKRDYWGRKYEDSSYQWLPTYFDIGVDGTCSICDYINNIIPREENVKLYSALENLFSQALPFLESVYSYGKEVKSRLRHDGDSVEHWSDDMPSPIKEKYCSLRGQRLQVITKIVDYELEPGQSYEGVWHVEGMSHEEIVATALYVLHCDDEIDGGDILFKRAFHQGEASYVFSMVSQDRPSALEEMIFDGLIPLGKVQTLPGRLIVFPNSHVHKVRNIKNKRVVGVDGNVAKEKTDSQSTLKGKRRIVVFFLVNPEKRIISTREILPQQHTMTREAALDHRIQLMQERKYTKQDWNVRAIELCEH